MENFQEFKNRILKVIVPLYKDSALAYFNATTTGDHKEYEKSEKLNIEFSKVFSNKDDFVILKKIKENGVSDPLEQRELDELYIAFLSNQIDPKFIEQEIKLQSKIEKSFNLFRVNFRGKELTDNQVDDLLKKSTNSDELREAWLASKEIGQLVEKDLVELVKLRNQSAKLLGFSDYHKMSLAFSDQKQEDLDKLFDELDALTADSYKNAKDEIDESLSKRLNISKNDLMPWHYQDRFLQESPSIFSYNADRIYEGKDLIEIAKNYFQRLGLPIESMIEKSDLYEKPNKYQHAYCIDIDHEGDIRVVENIISNKYWMDTTLHEFGHAVYDKFTPKDLPWLLREPAHIFTTEGIAILFGRQDLLPEWVKANLGVELDQKSATESLKSIKFQKLIFSRWCQIMYHFEREMYINPDQDLNDLWWNLTQKYQLIKRPRESKGFDWATKIHIASVPAYYHNYMLGELYSSQLLECIVTNIYKEDFANQSLRPMKEIGEYLKQNVFALGKKYKWDEFVKISTGKQLSPESFAKEFVD